MMLSLTIDQIIVITFLIITLVVGLWAGKGIKDIKDYAIANKSYGTPILLMTLLATMIGGGSTTGDVAQVYKIGILYSVISLAFPIALMVLAYFIAPKFDSRFDGMISIS